MRRAFACLIRSTAAIVEFPVASIGSSTMTGRSLRSSRHLEVILHRLQRLRIAVKAHVTDPGRGDQIEHALQKPVSRAKDRDQDELLARQEGRPHLGQRRFDRARFRGEITRDLVAQQEGDFPQQEPEPGRVGLLLPHEGQPLCRISG